MSRKDNNKVCEPVAIYGMSENLVNSGLITQRHDLSTEDKKRLISFITQEVVYDEDVEDDVDWDTFDCDLPPYTIDELHARIEKSHQQYLRGEVYTEKKVQEELRKEFPWLQSVEN